eukprot:CAMPEP_0175877176 /NCGR_PEP_ID=MMETSP0107_2-20121207/40469_1 /TAXON_ID=195067 ORGANISM="Goniomonas pacifica, Strain CCMP1869" /NCGR_SAMPLE_ID=MMETSP0107_2 /ASSEMBLY_ACC=CAM_ASM_000203 /LENGTH=187 /DNA_ID=CAMNT_0017196485 /DNA_START=38 /DNA_END=598 /DNA_ORIENTATION=-
MRASGACSSSSCHHGTDTSSPSPLDTATVRSGSVGARPATFTTLLAELGRVAFCKSSAWECVVMVGRLGVCAARAVEGRTRTGRLNLSLNSHRRPASLASSALVRTGAVVGRCGRTDVGTRTVPGDVAPAPASTRSCLIWGARLAKLRTSIPVLSVAFTSALSSMSALTDVIPPCLTASINGVCPLE